VLIFFMPVSFISCASEHVDNLGAYGIPFWRPALLLIVNNESTVQSVGR